MPTLNWCYGAQSPDISEAVNEVIYAAHRYRNTLCALERDKRARYYEILRALAPTFVEAETTVADSVESIESERAKLQAARVQQRTRKPTGCEAIIERIAGLRPLLKEQRAKLKEIKQEVMSRDDVASALVANNDAHKAEQKSAKQEANLYWGTEATVKAASASFASGSPPKFARYTGEGQLAVQIQGGKDRHDMTSENTLCYLGEQSGKRRECFFRIASDESGKPVFAKICIAFHRPLPEGKVKWAYLERRKLADADKWTLRLTIDVPAPKQDYDPETYVAMHVGWHRRDSGLQVAAWRGSDGETGRVVLPNTHLEDYTRLDTVKQYRALLLNEAIEIIKSFRTEDVPEWFTEITSHVHQWRSPDRLAKLMRQWGEERFDADQLGRLLPQSPVEFSRRMLPGRADVPGCRSILQSAGWHLSGNQLDYFEATRGGETYQVRISNHIGYMPTQTKYFTMSSQQQASEFVTMTEAVAGLTIFEHLRRMQLVDRELWRHEARLSKRVSGRRSDVYRNLAANLSSRYGLMFFTKPDTAKLVKNSEPEAMTDDESKVHRASRQAATSVLLQYCGEKFPLRALRVDSRNLSRECNQCHHVNASVTVRQSHCEGCGSLLDSDENALQNTIARGLVAQKSGGLLALAEAVESKAVAQKEKLKKMQDANRAKAAERAARKVSVS